MGNLLFLLINNMKILMNYDDGVIGTKLVDNGT